MPKVYKVSLTVVTATAQSHSVRAGTLNKLAMGTSVLN
jgi:hypothetical protein